MDTFLVNSKIEGGINNRFTSEGTPSHSSTIRNLFKKKDVEVDERYEILKLSESMNWNDQVLIL